MANGKDGNGKAEAYVKKTLGKTARGLQKAERKFKVLQDLKPNATIRQVSYFITVTFAFLTPPSPSPEDDEISSPSTSLSRSSLGTFPATLQTRDHGSGGHTDGMDGVRSVQRAAHQQRGLPESSLRPDGHGA